ncbi:MAG: SulP family inorganic anion transporter [Chloroflexota bacterium]
MNNPINLFRNTAIELLSRPKRLVKNYSKDKLSADLIAGATVAIVLLPQSIAFALIAELPPQMGLYAAIIGAIFGALWGSSNHIHTGPTNASSLLVLSALSTAVPVGSAEYLIAAGLLAFMVGTFQLVMGLARMGVLVNFVSHSVVVGFTSGAGVLIILKQVPNILGLHLKSENILDTLQGVLLNVSEIHWFTFGLGGIAILAVVLFKRINKKAPTAFIAMASASFLVFLFGLDELGVEVIGMLPSMLPPLSDVSQFSFGLVSKLSTGALAVGAIGLVETSAISRSIAAQTHQRLNNNQEFVGQGLANIFVGLFSGYPTAGSFSRSALNYNARAKTPFAAIFSSLFVLMAMFFLAPLAVYLPKAALAGVLIMTALRIIDRAEIKKIWLGSKEDALIMAVTFFGTLVLHIEFAVLAGILLSLAVYIVKTSVPRVTVLAPTDDYNHLLHQPTKIGCPQLAIMAIEGDIYFGAVNHVEESILNELAKTPSKRLLLLHMRQVVNMDISGIHMLEMLMTMLREKNGDLFLTDVQPNVMTLMIDTGFYEKAGLHNFLNLDFAVNHLFYRVLDPAICIYECDLRIFKECQNLPKRNFVFELPLITPDALANLNTISPQALWERMQTPNGPIVIDVREPGEYDQGHIPNARLISLPTILSEEADLPQDKEVILVCRTGRRSARAENFLKSKAYDNITILKGGILAWEAAGLLEAVEEVAS